MKYVTIGKNGYVVEMTDEEYNAIRRKVMRNPKPYIVSAVVTLFQGLSRFVFIYLATFGLVFLYLTTDGNLSQMFSIEIADMTSKLNEPGQYNVVVIKQLTLFVWLIYISVLFALGGEIVNTDAFKFYFRDEYEKSRFTRLEDN